MFKFNRLVPVLLVCALAGVAYSKAGRVKVLTAAGAGLTENADVGGGVVMNYHDSSGQQGAVTEIQVNVKGLGPDSTYGVQVQPGVTSPLAFTTNQNGHGHWHGFVGFDLVPENPVVRIFVYDGNINEIAHVSFDELRAIGCLTDDCTVGDPCNVAADCDDDFLCTVDTCDGGYCFHAPLDCGENSYCSTTHYNCETGCVEPCTTDGETGCCNTFDPCPLPAPPACPCPGGYCGCPETPCPE